MLNDAAHEPPYAGKKEKRKRKKEKEQKDYFFRETANKLLKASSFNRLFEFMSAIYRPLSPPKGNSQRIIFRAKNN